MGPIWLEVTAITPEATDCSTIFLRRLDSQPLDYRAGQFLTFLLSIHGHELRRSYSLSSAPGIDAVPAITVKRVPNGEASRYLLDHLAPGDRLQSLPASGRFALDTSADRHFFIAAGSGMTPVISLMKTAMTAGKTEVVLISQQHDGQSILFEHTLRGWERNSGRFSWVNLLTTERGRLNNELLEDLVEELTQGKEGRNVFYLCGPPTFMRMAQFTLRLMGYPQEDIRKEHFTVEYVPPPPPPSDIGDPRPRRITINRQGKTIVFEAVWPMTILQAALAHQIALPYSCRGGRCSTCVARCLSGKVRMSINEVLTGRDLEQGLVLTCVGYAQTDVELEF